MASINYFQDYHTLMKMKFISIKNISNLTIDIQIVKGQILNRKSSQTEKKIIPKQFER